MSTSQVVVCSVLAVLLMLLFGRRKPGRNFQAARMLNDVSCVFFALAFGLLLSYGATWLIRSAVHSLMGAR